MVASFASLPNDEECGVEHTTALVSSSALVSNLGFEVVPTAILPVVGEHRDGTTVHERTNAVDVSIMRSSF